MDFLTAESIVALLTLVALEIVLGIDNVIFIAILSSKLPQEQQARARSTGIGLAVITRILLLLSITWIMQLTQPLFNIFGNDISGRDLILLVGGLFLIGKSTYEIHEKLEASDHTGAAKVAASFASVIFQIVLIDIVFSLDSVITAVGMSNEIVIMVLAVIIAVIIMMMAAGTVSDFVERHPTVKMLALAFLVMIGVALLIEGMGEHINKNYIYFAMGFSVLVETLNLRMVRNRTVREVEAEKQREADIRSDQR
ncbi:MAG: TerC family protein, partial [Flavobacteriales bacterium]|nr:TerC family protein [Flavobacteriales bacterium]